MHVVWIVVDKRDEYVVEVVHFVHHLVVVSIFH